jgi:large subunit ribosomal protein L5
MAEKQQKEIQEKAPAAEKQPKAPKEKAAPAAEKQPKAPKEKAPAEPQPKYISRMRTFYDNEIRPALAKELEITNPMAIPRVEKIVLNMGVGEAITNKKILEDAVRELTAIAGQKPVINKARKSIATFKLREGMPIGTSVVLRKDRMFDFLDRLISVALPRVKDFRGISGKAFDGRGNYTLGIKDFMIFPEIDFNKVEVTKGLNVTICTTARNDKEAKALLKMFGMPFNN